jgi:hypothetical protein
VCVRAFIWVNAHTCMSIYVYCVSKKRFGRYCTLSDDPHPMHARRRESKKNNKEKEETTPIF